MSEGGPSLPSSGDRAGLCPRCSSDATHVSYEDMTAAYCRTCRHYWLLSIYALDGLRALDGIQQRAERIIDATIGHLFP